MLCVIDSRTRNSYLVKTQGMGSVQKYTQDLLNQPKHATIFFMPGLCIFASFKAGCRTDNSQPAVKCRILGCAAYSVWEDRLGMWSQRKIAAAQNHPSLSCSVPGTGAACSWSLWLHGCKACVGMFRTRFKTPQPGDANR